MSHGYLGADPISPTELRARARREVEQYPTVSFVEGRVERLTGVRALFDLGVGGSVLSARRVILATGVRDSFPEVENFFEHYGADVFHCASCDG